MTASVGLMSAMKNTVSMTAHKICFGLRKYLLWSGVELSPVKPKAHFPLFAFGSFSNFADTEQNGRADSHSEEYVVYLI